MQASESIRMITVACTTPVTLESIVHTAAIADSRLLRGKDRSADRPPSETGNELGEDQRIWRRKATMSAARR